MLQDGGGGDSDMASLVKSKTKGAEKKFGIGKFMNKFKSIPEIQVKSNRDNPRVGTSFQESVAISPKPPFTALPRYELLPS